MNVVSIIPSYLSVYVGNAVVVWRTADHASLLVHNLLEFMEVAPAACTPPRDTDSPPVLAKQAQPREPMKMCLCARSSHFAGYCCVINSQCCNMGLGMGRCSRSHEKITSSRGETVQARGATCTSITVPVMGVRERKRR